MTDHEKVYIYLFNHVALPANGGTCRQRHQPDPVANENDKGNRHTHIAAELFNCHKRIG